MKLALSHGKNPDISGRGYWTEPTDSGKRRLVPVTSFEHASVTFRGYIERNQLGAGNCCFAPILDDAGKEIAHVSYNGRVWEGPTTTPFGKRKEIKLRD